MYELKNVSFDYKNKAVLKNISIALEKGKFYSIIGPNGSGKSTLINVMTGNLIQKSGQVLFLGTPIGNIKINELSKSIAVLAQNNHIPFPFTCKEIVLMGRAPFSNGFRKFKKEDHEIVDDCMKSTDTLKFADLSITAISGGERQRVMLAKVLAQTPQILFLDEAFSSMDMCFRFECMKLLKALVQRTGITVVSVNHDLDTAYYFSDTIIALKNGEVIEMNNPKSLANEDFINYLFGIRLEGISDTELVVLPRIYMNNIDIKKERKQWED